MNVKLTDWIIWIVLFTVLVFTTIKTESKIKQLNVENKETVLSETLAVTKNTIPKKEIETIVEVEPGMVIVPVGVTEETCTPETCPPPITYSRQTIFSRWRRR